ncbi:hypothetical protein AWZ03_007342 [Drosophila navojoa]|uniref:Uncharacterized protein n=1 Tax=Drosophila navojoa TaxID=7232 RepID=A0A484BBP1_DRONA|nr:hypothetical protein AWZ03_007342 [Drosophila navojoa]
MRENVFAKMKRASRCNVRNKKLQSLSLSQSTSQFASPSQSLLKALIDQQPTPPPATHADERSVDPAIR